MTMDPVNQKLLLVGGGLGLLRILTYVFRRIVPEKPRKLLLDYTKSGIAATFIAFIVATFLFQISRVEGISMAPTLHTGQYTLIDKLSYRLHHPHRGDVIVFRSPTDPKLDYIKRVIGLPGDIIDIRQTRVFVNHKPLNETYLKEPAYYCYGPERVPKGKIFVLGDNRNNSLDSHWFGCISNHSIRGRACAILWPPREAHSVKLPK